MADVKAWTAPSLPDAIADGQLTDCVEVDLALLGPADTEVTLPSPRAIPAEGIYVGYSFTITTAKKGPDMFPVITAPATTDGALFVRIEGSGGWEDLYSQGVGGLMLQVLLQGSFAEHHALPGQVLPQMVGVGETTTAAMPVANIGTQAISSIDYTMSDDVATSGELHAEAATPIAFGETQDIIVGIPADGMQRKSTKTLTITKVNGQPNTQNGSSTLLTCYSIADNISRNVAVEEYTGVQCGNCPRGIVGMEKLRETFGERCVGISIHQYSKNDAMYIREDSYARLGFQNAPMCLLNRSWEADPYYGSISDGEHDICFDFRMAMQKLTRCSVTVSGTIDDDFTQVDAVARIESLFDDSYSLEFVLVGDGLKGTAANWLQSNYYYSFDPDMLPEDLRQFAEGGTLGLSRISGMAYNDVAIASSYVEDKNQVADVTVGAGETKEVDYVLPLPTSDLKEALRSARLYVVALVIDEQGHVLNADKQPVPGTGATAIGTVEAKTHAAMYFTPDGLRHAQPQKGVNIVAKPDGKTMMKVVNSQ